MPGALPFQPGNLIRARGREWVVLPEQREDILRLRPLGGSDEDATIIYLPLEPNPPEAATFPLPDPTRAGTHDAGLLMQDALRLKLRAGAGPFRSFGNLTVEPRAYQLVPLLMALRQETVRLLIADDVGIGKTIEACLIARELLDRGEIRRLSVICPPHLCEQWQEELAEKFSLSAEIVRTATARRLERGLPAGQSIFEVYPVTVVSLDYIKSERRRDEFIRACPEFVIVEEAHTCAGGGGTSRHLRYRLLRDLANDSGRHMLFLTATPHNGDEEAFHNLLALLDPKFKGLQDVREGPERGKLREELARFFVQRRRPDISEWKDSTIFPDRETAEMTYPLTGAWGQLFDAILAYARTMVERVSRKSRVQQRMNWWAALALLRCASSSPAAASIALRTRLKAVKGASETEQIDDLDRLGAETVMDGVSESELNIDETIPAGTTEDAEVSAEDAQALEKLIRQSDALKGPQNDPKLAALAEKLIQLIKDGFRPVIFCRYIATAHYVAAELQKLLPEKKTLVTAITGELTPEEREERVLRLQEDARTPVLVATDCLSEGVNLQHLFNAVVHYDLVWNPTRHEQREGRVDRFGQPDKTVRALMLYGENNPVDGAVLKVILRKAEKIRKELGVSVPIPSDTNQVMETVMRTVLLHSGSIAQAYAQPQLQLDFGETEQQLEFAWESAKEKVREGRRTVFAQRRLRPEDVLPEWQKTVAVLGGEEDVTRFVKTAAERLRTPLEPRNEHFVLATNHLPAAVREQLAAAGIDKPLQITFRHPTPAGVEYVHRAHPLVAVLADYVAEEVLSEEQTEVATRSGAIFTDAVENRTALYLLRLRSQLTAETLQGGHVVNRRYMLSEECLMVQITDNKMPQILTAEEGKQQMAFKPSRNMALAQRQRQIERELQNLDRFQDAFGTIALTRADSLLADHTRVRAAGVGRSEARGARYSVKPTLPVDVIGIYLLLPTPPL